MKGAGKKGSSKFDSPKGGPSGESKGWVPRTVSGGRVMDMMCAQPLSAECHKGQWTHSNIHGSRFNGTLVLVARLHATSRVVGPHATPGCTSPSGSSSCSATSTLSTNSESSSRTRLPTPVAAAHVSSTKHRGADAPRKSRAATPSRTKSSKPCPWRGSGSARRDRLHGSRGEP